MFNKQLSKRPALYCLPISWCKYSQMADSSYHHDYCWMSWEETSQLALPSWYKPISTNYCFYFSLCTECFIWAVNWEKEKELINRLPSIGHTGVQFFLSFLLNPKQTAHWPWSPTHLKRWSSALLTTHLPGSQNQTAYRGGSEVSPLRNNQVGKRIPSLSMKTCSEQTCAKLNLP